MLGLRRADQPPHGRRGGAGDLAAGRHGTAGHQHQPRRRVARFGQPLLHQREHAVGRAVRCRRCPARSRHGCWVGRGCVGCGWAGRCWVGRGWVGYGCVRWGWVGRGHRGEHELGCRRPQPGEVGGGLRVHSGRAQRGQQRMVVSVEHTVVAGGVGQVGGDR